MAQGKMKVKSRLPEGVKKKNKSKGAAATRRVGAPQPGRTASGGSAGGREARDKMKAALTKLVNAEAEKQLRARAAPDAGALSAAQARAASAATAPVPAAR